MYIQFFGNYLLEHAYVTQEQLFSAMQQLSEAHMKLGTLAIHYGYMTPEEVDDIVICQTHKNQKFGEAAIENGYLTEDQVNSLLSEQKPDFLLLGQVLVDDGILTNTELENIILNYRSENEMIDLDMTTDNHDTIMQLIDNLMSTADDKADVNLRLYFELLFNNFIRFVGEDFTPLQMEALNAFPTDRTINQTVHGGGYLVNSYISMDSETAIAFASRYVGDTFTDFDEYVSASLEDFMNLHNGLFIVNLSNSESEEFVIDPPTNVKDPILDFGGTAFHFPILYSFGIVHFIAEIKKA